MVFFNGMNALTLAHVLLSLIGILSGFIVVFGMFASRRLNRLTAVFLTTTVLTSATGYLFHVTHLLPSHIVGAISLVVLTVAILARYSLHLAGPWRWIYVVCAVLALYLNCFVLVVQAFLKIPTLHSLAPTGSEPPFLVAQVAVLLLFVIIGIGAAIKFHPR
jgi:hypothetical protein